MSDFSTVVAALDDSDVASSVLRLAQQLAPAEGGHRLFAAHGVRPFDPAFAAMLWPLACLGDDHDAIAAELVQNATKSLQKRHRDVFANTPDAIRVAWGRPADAILDVAGRVGPDITVMGTTGTHRGAPGLIGATTAEVLRRAPNAVLVARRLELPTELKRFAVAIDFGPFSRRLLEYSLKLASRMGAKVVPIAVIPTLEVLDSAGLHRGQALQPQAALKEAKRLATQLVETLDLPFGVAARRTELLEPFVFRNGDPAAEVIAGAGDAQADLVIVARTRDALNDGPRLGRVTDALVRTAPSHVLVVPPTANETA
jgi:nucleotide-binding universal stress UspA family protein